MSGEAAPTAGQIVWDYLSRQAAVIVLRVAGDGTVLFANRYALELTGLPLVGGSLDELLIFPGESGALPWLAPSAEPRIMNIRVAAGLPQTLYVSTAALDGEWLLLGQADPGEQERLRREVLELNHELTALSRELALANAQLDQLNKLKNQFLGMASHDLRKPTGLIMNNAELLQEMGTFEPGSQPQVILERIQRSATAMAALINDFLDVAMIEAGRLPLDVGIVDASQLFAGAAALTETAARKRQIVVSIDLDEALPRLRVDGGKLEQVLTNLLSNAIEHSPDGGAVNLGACCYGDGLRFWVKDYGTGLSAEQVQTLFREFAGSAVPKPSGERSIGLGLVLVRKVVEAHGGKMFVESEPARGSLFGFDLPAGCRAAEGVGRLAD